MSNQRAADARRASGKKRTRSDAGAHEGHETKTASAPPPDAPPKKKQKRRRQKAKDDSRLDADERERRRVQRELRELAVKLRGSGSEYKPQKHKRKLYLASGAGTARRERKKEKTEQKSKVRVVVLPIFWKERPDEMEAVLGAARKAESLLSVLGVRVVTDTNNEFKPGERMKHWETLGVPIRIEIGPQDVKRGSVVVAVAEGEAGTVAQKTSVRLSHKLIKKVRVLLQAAGVEVQAPAGKKAAQESEVGEGGEGDASDEENEDDEGKEDAEGGNPAGAALRQATGNEAGSSGQGEDAGGDEMDPFDLDVEAEEETLTMSKKQLAKKKRQEDRAKRKENKKKAKQAAARTGSALPSWEDEEKMKASKSKTKVVVFK